MFTEHGRFLPSHAPRRHYLRQTGDVQVLFPAGGGRSRPELSTRICVLVEVPHRPGAPATSEETVAKLRRDLRVVEVGRGQAPPTHPLSIPPPRTRGCEKGLAKRWTRV